MSKKKQRNSKSKTKLESGAVVSPVKSSGKSPVKSGSKNLSSSLKSNKSGSLSSNGGSGDGSGSGAGNGFKWGLVIAVGIVAIFGNIKFNYFPFSERLVVLIILGLVMLGLALSTKSGKVFTRFVMDARNEMRKVSWPSRHEMTQLTITVIIVVALASLILWAVDGLFHYIINSLIM